MVRNEREIKELEEELSKITGFIADFGTDREFNDEDVKFSNDVTDALSWVLEEISTEHFRNSSYLNITSLQKVVKVIEKRTGRKLADYE